MSDEKLVVNESPKKKISFFSAILIVLGGSIGAGIFLRSKKVLEYSANNLIWAILVWLIAGFAIICMALALIEVASGRNDNLGMIGWAKAFNTLYIYKGTKAFMTYLYLPFTYFFMPYYVIVQFQDGLSAFNGVNINFGGSKFAPWFYFLIGLGLTLWMLFTAGISSRAGNIQNWIVTLVKFLPIILVVLISFYLIVENADTRSSKLALEKITKEKLFNKNATTLFGLSPFLAVFGALGGIFFAFDGFYVSAGVQSEMQNPEKTPAALAIGLASITGIYIVIATFMTLAAGSGGFYDYFSLISAKWLWLFGLVNIFISVGIVGILNGFTMWATRWIEDLIKEGELTVPASVYKYMKNAKMPIVGTLFILIISLPFMVIFTAIGAYAYFGGGYDEQYGYKIDNLLTFSDLMADWMAVFAFAFIMASVGGAIKNRKQKFIAVVENKHTIWAGSVAMVFVLLTMLFMILNPFVSWILQLANNNYKDASGKLTTDFLGVVCASALFIVYTTIAFASTPIEKAVVMAQQKSISSKLGKVSGKELDDLMLAKELNDLAVKTFTEARV